jgi:hypothetical protein
VFTGASGAHETTAYLGAFDPLNPAAGYLGSSGRNEAGADVRVFSVTVPAMDDFTLVTTWSAAAAPGGEPAFDLYVANCGEMVLTGIAPNAGPIEGGQNVTVAGSGFEGAAPAVSIGVAATTNVVVVDDSTLIATTGANAAGTYDVTATSGAAVATLAQAYTYGAAEADGGVVTDGGLEGGVDAGRDASTGGPTQGGPTQGSSSSSSGGTTNDEVDGASDDDDDPSAGDGGVKRVSSPKKKTAGEEEYVCACNEVGRGTTPGMGAFATLALGILAVLRLRRRR